MSGNVAEGQGGRGHSNPPQSLIWALMVSLRSLCLCVFGGEALRLLPAKMAAAGRLAASFSCLSSPHSRTAAGKVGQECLGQSSKVPAPPRSGLEPVLQSPRFCQGTCDAPVTFGGAFRKIEPL